MKKHNVPHLIATLCIALLLITTGYSANEQQAYARAEMQVGSRTFPETGHTIKGRFLEYWEQHGGLAQQGYPISAEIQEVSEVNGNTYAVQYFERATFELHPENQPPHDVLLSLLGVLDYREHYPGGAADEKPNAEPGSVLFKETGKRVGGAFLTYWQAHGGLMQQGYPISNEFQARSPLDGKTYTMQYFERAVFELHPENRGTPYEVLLSQLGTFKYQARYVTQAQVPSVPRPAAGRRQFNIRGSDRYLVWGEAATTLDTYDIKALDLKTNTVLTVSDAPDYQGNQQISDSIVVWEDNRHSCATCDHDIRGKDLATGSEFQIATGPEDQSTPTVAGRSVAWVEGIGSTSKLLLKDLDGGKVTEVVSGARPAGTLSQPAISEQYVVWALLGKEDQNTHSYVAQLQAYERATGITKNVAQFSLPASVPVSISVSGQRVVWNEGGVRAADLKSGETSTLYSGVAFAPLIKGAVVLWTVTPLANPGAGGFDIYGVNLDDKDRKVVQPVTGGTSTGDVAIAGDWLAWQTKSGPDDGRFNFKRLSEAVP
ncbi:MAG TPA: hypothetical protein VGE45_17960 [Chloroflexia bacterium]|jgi:hypothetical protein